MGYSIDNGEYERYLSKDGKKEQGVKKISLNIGRNQKCPCGSKKKFKDCCKKKGRFYKAKKNEFKAPLWFVMKVKIGRLFKRKNHGKD